MNLLSSRPTRFPPATLLLILGLLLLITGIGATASGALSIPWSDLPRLLLGSLQPEDTLAHRVLIDIRLPRVLFSSLTGAALAIAGVTMQALFRNPLAEPGLVGISAGAALGAVAAIVLTSGGLFMVAPAAFAGSLAATWIAYCVGRHYHGIAGLLLAGIAINTIAGSAIGLLTYVANDTQLRDLTFWTMGSLAGASWRLIALLAPLLLLIMLYLCRQWRVFNALLLGEREAAHLGFEMATVRRRLIVLTALLIGQLVAVTGGIGFIGLVVPHLVRLILGAHHRYLLPVSMVAGALLLTLADWLARVLISPAELPIGLVTSLLGGPFFFWLLSRARTAMSG